MKILTAQSGNAVAKFGEYVVSNSTRGGYIWIEQEGGEGMEIDETAFIDALRKFYSDNF